MNYIKDVVLHPTCESFNMIIEIPKGTKSKFELKDGTFDDVIEVRQVKYKYPFYYGCFPETYAGDGDPADAVLISNLAFYQKEIVEVIPIGVLKTIDNGEQDDKIFVVPVAEPIKNIEKLRKEAIKFLHKYKGKHADMIIEGYFNETEACTILEQCHKEYINRNVPQRENNVNQCNLVIF